VISLAIKQISRSADKHSRPSHVFFICEVCFFGKGLGLPPLPSAAAAAVAVKE
jgi:hypothetical protein